MTPKNIPQSRKSIRLTVNGQSHSLEIGCRVTLAELLREQLGLTGTKVGCNRGECGSCTVIMNGSAVYSCSVLAVEADGKEIKTIEGLSNGEKLHPLQLAFIEHDALQCGYCTPGMILSAEALLAKNPHPSEEEIRTAVDGNLCRCGCYPNIVAATLQVAGRGNETGGGNA